MTITEVRRAAPELAIIIVNWNSVKLLQACLSSIYAQTKDLAFEVIVIDNASFDGSAAVLARDFPDVAFIQSPENLGFAKANNLAFVHSTADFVVFLNPDTELMGPAFNVMLEFMKKTPRAGVVGARLLNSDGSLQTSCVQRFPTVLNRTIDAELLRRLTPRFHFWGTRTLLENPTATSPVEVISGACQLARREVFEKVGRFEESFFMYAEDADLCLKMRNDGYQNYVVGAATITHHGGQSSSAKEESSFAAIVMRESLYRMFALRQGRIYASFYRTVTMCVAMLRLALLSALGVITLGLFHRSKMLISGRKWIKVLRWSLGFEPWAERLTQGPVHNVVPVSSTAQS